MTGAFPSFERERPREGPGPSRRPDHPQREIEEPSARRGLTLLCSIRSIEGSFHAFAATETFPT